VNWKKKKKVEYVHHQSYCHVMCWYVYPSFWSCNWI